MYWTFWDCIWMCIYIRSTCRHACSVAMYTRIEYACIHGITRTHTNIHTRTPARTLTHCSHNIITITVNVSVVHAVSCRWRLRCRSFCRIFTRLEMIRARWALFFTPRSRMSASVKWSIFWKQRHVWVSLAGKYTLSERSQDAGSRGKTYNNY